MPEKSSEGQLSCETNAAAVAAMPMVLEKSNHLISASTPTGVAKCLQEFHNSFHYGGAGQSSFRDLLQADSCPRKHTYTHTHPHTRTQTQAHAKTHTHT